MKYYHWKSEENNSLISLSSLSEILSLLNSSSYSAEVYNKNQKVLKKKVIKNNFLIFDFIIKKYKKEANVVIFFKFINPFKIKRNILIY